MRDPSLSYRLARARRCGRKWRCRLGVEGTATRADAERLVASVGRGLRVHLEETSVYVGVGVPGRRGGYRVVIGACSTTTDAEIARGLAWGAGAALFRSRSRIPLGFLKLSRHSWPEQIHSAFAAAFLNG